MTYYAHCEEGLVSRDGWVIMDDSLRPRFDGPGGPAGSPAPARYDREWPWVGGPPAENLANLQAGRGIAYSDLYFLGHGLDFPGALRDYTTLAGPIPLLPRYALGPGFSRWYAWNEHEEAQHIIADGFASHGVPLDQLSIDMVRRGGITCAQRIPRLVTRCAVPVCWKFALCLSRGALHVAPRCIRLA